LESFSGPFVHSHFVGVKKESNQLRNYSSFVDLQHRTTRASILPQKTAEEMNQRQISNPRSVPSYGQDRQRSVITAPFCALYEILE
jgi:hypothetical protein